MSTIQFGGVISGLNTSGIIDALMAVKKQPLTDLQNREANLTAEQTAYGQLGSSINDLIAKVKAFTVSNAGASRTAASSNTSLFTASSRPNATVGQYSISVDRLATATHATSSAALGTPISETIDTSVKLANTKLQTAITSGFASVKVDGGTYVVQIGDPATTSLQKVVDSVVGALQTHLQATDPTSVVTASYVGGQLQLAVSGNTTTHSFSFGGLDTSNAITALGLDSVSVTDQQNATVTGTTYADPALSLTVDGNTISVPLGDEKTTSLQDVMDAVQNALQTQLQATDPGSTVTASLVNGRIQLAVAGNTTTHSFSFADTGLTSKLATYLGLDSQSVTDTQDATVTGTSYLDPVLSSLNTPGTISAGQISAIVDGVLVHYTVGDPTQTTMLQLMDGLASSLQAQLRAGGPNKGADAGATVGVDVVGNKLQIAVSGGTLTHSISFGAASDTTNALTLLGIANASVSNALNPTITAATSLGMVRTLSALDSAGLTGLTSTHTGVLTINGTAISYDTAVDTLSTLITRINNSNAGVIASVDRTNDKIILTRKDTGALAIDIADTSGTLGAALKLAPGTTNSQVIGQTSQVTVDGRTITSTSNTVTSAVDGVTLNLLSQSGTPATLTVGVDSSSVSGALSSLVTSFNSLADQLDTLTVTTPGTKGGNAGTSGPLATDSTAKTMLLDLREMFFDQSGSGTYKSLGDLGVNTGMVGSTVGTTNRLQLDTGKLQAALSDDPTAISNLLDSATGPVGLMLNRLTALNDSSNPNSYIKAHQDGIQSEISSIQAQESEKQEMIDNYQAALEQQYATMEATLAQLQQTSASIASYFGTSTSGSASNNSSSSG